VYAYSRDALERWVALPPNALEMTERLEQLRPLAAGIPIGVAIAEELPAAGIDTEEDLSRANARWDAFIAGR
jgi:3-deoxy-manno-octulosonate cytidylyltransferase (CMP-KDO synthetase)